MSDRDLIDGLIATYRALNFTVRPHPETQLRAAGPHGSVRQAVTRLRDRELRFSDALKARLTGVHMPEIFDEAESPVVGTESEDDTTRARLSQFGTAREATLVRLRSVTESAWDQVPDAGGQPIRAETRQLLEHDQQALQQIRQALAAIDATAGSTRAGDG
jgi:hypothetical protein